MTRGDTTEAVQDLARKHGISERTAWRWFAAMRANQSTDLIEERVCGWCRTALPKGASMRRRFCDTYCRVNRWRRDKRRQTFAAARPSLS